MVTLALVACTPPIVSPPLVSTLPPGTTCTAPELVIVCATSLTASITGTEALPVLFAVLVSLVAEVLLVNANVPVAGAVAVTVQVTLPLAGTANGGLTTAPALLIRQLVTVAPPPAAVHVAPVAAVALLFVQVSVPVTLAPGETTAGSPLKAESMSEPPTVVVIDGLQRAGNGLVAAAHPGSPPPRTSAVLVTLGLAAEVGVTGIVNETVLPGPGAAAKPEATVQLTV